MINIDEYEKYIKETDWKEHEYINNLLYSFFIRTLDDQKKIDKFIYEPAVNYTLKLKDVIIYKTEYVRITLQEIIYTICPDYYKEKQQNINDGINLQDIKVFKDFYYNKVEENKKNNINKPIIQTFIYTDLNKSEIILNEKDILEKIEEVYTYKKINMNFKYKQLNIPENKFITLHDVNINLPTNALISYIEFIKTQHKIKKNKNIFFEINKKLEELTNDKINEIKYFIKYISIHKDYHERHQFFINKKRFIKNIKDIEDIENISKKNFFKYIKFNKIYKLKQHEIYKKIVLNKNKLSTILITYDLMKNKEKYLDKSTIKKIQIIILGSRRKFFITRDYDDLNKYTLHNEKKHKKLEKLLNDLYKLFHFIPENENIEIQNINQIIKEINQENEKDLDEIMKKIYKLIEPSKLNIFKENYPYLSERTIYKYYEIAKFYIDEENYKLLLDENYI